MSTSTPQLTERQRRERTFYDLYGSRLATREVVSFAPILGKERRPWNPYWRVFELARERFDHGSRLLDFGCGWGSNTVVFAKIGYQVDCFDLSPENVAITSALASKYDLSLKITAQVMPAEALSYPDNTFDCVVGVDILHHVDIVPAVTEAHRVLKSGGKAIFCEPLMQSVFDTLRNSRAGRRLRPNAWSFERHITEDERKLDASDIKAIRAVFPNLEVEPFRILSRLETVVPSYTSQLERLDRLLRIIPGFSWWRGTGVLIMTREA